ncbi:MAG TPA: hypothetical protein VHG52_13630, partial [Thermomicrobiales bacterium]|nr:hypothetical protein [Thermomicrobiales bacterium]
SSSCPSLNPEEPDHWASRRHARTALQAGSQLNVFTQGQRKIATGARIKPMAPTHARMMSHLTRGGIRSRLSLALRMITMIALIRRRVGGPAELLGPGE